MATVFLICAALGGTILVCQFVMTLLGLGGDGLHGDAGGGDLHDLAGDHAFDDHAGGDHAGDHPAGEHPAEHHHSSWLFGVLSFRTIVAAATFFGLTGMAAHSAGLSHSNVIILALAGGAAAMYAVYGLMRLLWSLKSEGTVRIQHALGRTAAVYLRIPGHNAGAGKVQLSLQNRTMEYPAVTHGDDLPTGAEVVVVEVINPGTLVVEPLPAPVSKVQS